MHDDFLMKGLSLFAMPETKGSSWFIQNSTILQIGRGGERRKREGSRKERRLSMRVSMLSTFALLETMRYHVTLEKGFKGSEQLSFACPHFQNNDVYLLQKVRYQNSLTSHTLCMQRECVWFASTISHKNSNINKF